MNDDSTKTPGMNSYNSVCNSKSIAEMRLYLHLKLRIEDVLRTSKGFYSRDPRSCPYLFLAARG